MEDSITQKLQKKLGEEQNGYRTGDYNYVCETLYRKSTGEYFLHGEGGTLSRYATRYGSNLSSGSTIIPYSEAEAKEWAEKHLDADKYRKVKEHMKKIC